MYTFLPAYSLPLRNHPFPLSAHALSVFFIFPSCIASRRSRARASLPVISRLWKFSCRSDHIVISLRTPEARTERPLERRVFVRTFLSSLLDVEARRVFARRNARAPTEAPRKNSRRGPIRKRGTVSPCVTSSSCAERVIVENSPSIKVLHAGLLSPERKTRERSDPCSLSQIPLHFLRILSPCLVLSPTDTRTRTYTYRETREKCAGALTARALGARLCAATGALYILLDLEVTCTLSVR